MDYVQIRPYKEKALLIRLGYPYGKPQTWLPMDLTKVAAVLEAVGIKTEIADLNHQKPPDDISSYHYIGIGTFGSPYIPDSIRMARYVKQTTGRKPIVGGKVIEKLKPDEFEMLYGDNAIQIRNHESLERSVNSPVPSVYKTNITNRIASMNPELLDRYLSSEFSFFTSQGCERACDFCAADRSVPEERIYVKETFSETVKEDLDALCKGAVELGKKELSMYLTALDLFQNPEPFGDVLRIFAAAHKEYGIDFRLRGLSRIDSFLNALQEYKEFYKLIPQAGLKIVGFGVDGTTEEIWQAQHKGNKGLSEADKAFDICNQVGITPEALLVMGFHPRNGKPGDTKESLNKNVDYALSRALKYRMVCRPHVAKDMMPGNNGWKDDIWYNQKMKLLKGKDTNLWFNLDVAAFASELTHPDEAFRHDVNISYRQIIDTLTPIGLCGTSPIMPYVEETKTYAEAWNASADSFNKRVPFDK